MNDNHLSFETGFNETLVGCFTNEIVYRLYSLIIKYLAKEQIGLNTIFFRVSVHF